ncbi:MAG TPA: hypothetical protein VHC22_34580 [Pirellulales bacterium]|nr:hypothetical protein [Pirellulales bacterium]
MNEHTPESTSAAQHETTDVRGRPMVLAALALAASVALVCLFLIWFFGRLDAGAKQHDPRLSPLAGDQSPPTPRLQTNPAKDLESMRKAEERALSTYRWIDKERGVVQLPVERAIDLLVAEGLPKTSAEVPRVEPAEESAAKEDAR